MGRLILGLGLSLPLSVYLEQYLTLNEIQLVCVSTLADGFLELSERVFSFAVVDLAGIPAQARNIANGPKLCGQSPVPSLILCSWTNWRLVAQLLEEGADQCIPNITPPPVIARQIVASLRRFVTGSPLLAETPVLYRGEIEITPQYHRVVVRGQEVKLSRKEFELLILFAHNPGIIFSAEQISKQLWRPEVGYSRGHTIECLISELRRKIEVNPKNPTYIFTIRGVGYRFKSNYGETRVFSENSQRFP